MADVNDQTVEAEKARRMTLSRVVEMLLEKREHGASSVSLSRNAKGETQIEVVVRTAGDGPVQTVEDAETVARTVYDSLRAKYPTASGHAGVTPPTTGQET